MSSTDLITQSLGRLSAISSSLGAAFEPGELDGQLALECEMLSSPDLRGLTEEAVTRAYGETVEFCWVGTGSRERVSSARGRSQRARGVLYVYAQDDNGSVMDASVTFAETFALLRVRGSFERAYVALPAPVSDAPGLKA